MMSGNKNIRERILNQPSYWVEKINGHLYDAIVSFMEKHNMKQKDLAIYLDISPGRVSQILNNGDINFSLDKIIQIAIKIDKFPVFEFEDKSAYLKKVEDLPKNEKDPNLGSLSNAQSRSGQFHCTRPVL
ncbi:MAG: helix-turn-helix domain-containing protein [Mangrovibacterium sp.]